jgi:hypothetical protein
MSKFIINREVIDTLVDAEMQSVKGMRKPHLFQLVRDLLEERVMEMSDEAIYDYYNELILGKI